MLDCRSVRAIQRRTSRKRNGHGGDRCCIMEICDEILTRESQLLQPGQIRSLKWYAL